MKKTIISIILFTLVIRITYSQEKNFIAQNHIEVIGKVEKEIEPNEIYLTIILNENDFKKEIKVEDKEIEMINVLNNLGIDTKTNLRIMNFKGDFQHYLFKKNSVVKKKVYQLLITRTKILAKVFLKLDKLNISNVSISKVDNSNIEELKFELKAKAIQLSKKKAKNYANAIDQNIGKALFIIELNNLNNRYLNTNAMQKIVLRGYRSFDNKTELPVLSLQKIKISASVKVTYELK